jgi:hypothetical protein
MRYASRVAFMIMLAAPALAETPAPPPHDAKSWDLLIGAARRRGGTETKLDKSSSYVFQQQDGNFLTLTEWRSPVKRFVCVIAKDQKSTVCVQWETGRTTYGQRADAASPWKTRQGIALEETKEAEPQDGFLGKIAGFVGGALAMKISDVYKFYYTTNIVNK